LKEKLLNINKSAVFVSILIIVVAFEICIIFFSRYHNKVVASFSSQTAGVSSLGQEATQHVTAQSQININTATKEQLKTLPGVGDVIAQRIIDYRTEYGNFKNTSQIKNVKGIGEKTYSEIKELIKVE